MALVAVPQFLYPNRFYRIDEDAAFSAVTLDAASEDVNPVFEIPETGTVIGAGFRTMTVTTGATIDITLEGIDAATGLPDATPLANATGTAIIANTDDNLWITDGYGGGTAWGNVSVTRGQKVALCIAQPAASPGSMQVATLKAPVFGGFPYYTTNISGTPAKAGTVLPVLGLEYTGGIYYQICGGLYLPASVISAHSWDNNDATTEYGAKITVAMATRACGVSIGGEFDKGTDILIDLYSADGTTVIASTGTVDTNIQISYSGGAGDSPYTLQFTTPVELAAGAIVYVGIKPQGSAFTVDMQYSGANDTALMSAMPGIGNVIKVSRATQGTGAWTETTTHEPFISLICDRLSDGAGGSATRRGHIIGGI